MNLAGKRSQLAGGGEVGTGPGPGCGSCGGPLVVGAGLVVGGQKGGGSRHGGGAGVVVVATGGGTVVLGGTVVIGVGVNVTVADGCCTRLRGTQV